MAYIQLIGPGGLSEDEEPAAIEVLARVARLPVEEASVIYYALKEVKLRTVDLPAKTVEIAERNCRLLNDVHLDAKVIREPMSDGRIPDDPKATAASGRRIKDTSKIRIKDTIEPEVVREALGAEEADSVWTNWFQTIHPPPGRRRG